MTLSHIFKELDGISPPVQPKIDAKVHQYQETLLNWNPVCIKKEALFYQFITDSRDNCSIDIVPDACINVLFKCDAKEPSALLSGIFVEQKSLQLEPDTLYFGFKPYTVTGMKNYSGSIRELMNAHTDFELYFPQAEDIMIKLASANSFQQRIDLFKEYSSKYIVDTDYDPGFIDYLEILICTSKGQRQVNTFEKFTGYSERYCREKFKSFYGLTLKHYSRIMRFQNVLKMLLGDEDKDISELAYDNGYFDQAHFINDFKEFTNSSPKNFRRNYTNLKATALINSWGSN